MKGIIYRATSKTTGKSYIGQTVLPFDKRRKTHINEANRQNYNLACTFHKALKDLGSEDFIWYIEKELDVDNPEKLKNQLNKNENFYMNKYNSLKGGYNMKRGGSGYIKNFNLTKEERLILRREIYRFRKENDPNYSISRKNRRDRRRSDPLKREIANAKQKAWRDNHREEYREQRKQYLKQKDILDPSRVEKRKAYRKTEKYKINHKRRREFRKIKKIGEKL